MSGAHQDIIRREVQALLSRAPAFATLPDSEQAQLSHDIENVVGALSDRTSPASTDTAPTERDADFSGFVRSLVEGTFQAIVDGSTEQMRAYGALVKGVAAELSADGPRSAITPDGVREQVLAVMGHDQRIRPVGWPPKR